mmetsp:Transcript_25071/g.39399  ORF Transcript_25071/g.39399 Transcript_25071/m.39399 type:complete len:119 (+) Transcript_25071:303-659(+)
MIEAEHSRDTHILELFHRRKQSWHYRWKSIAEQLEKSSSVLDTRLLLFVPEELVLIDRARDCIDFLAEAWSSFTVFNDASHMIACSSGLISPESSIAAAFNDSDNKATTASYFGPFCC